MDVMCIRCDAELEQSITRLARDLEMTRSALIRELMERAVAAEAERTMTTA